MKMKMNDDIDIIERLKLLSIRLNDEGRYVDSDICSLARDEIERLRKYESLVRFISNDYHELSYEKVQWQRDDWKDLCIKLVNQDLE